MRMMHDLAGKLPEKDLDIPCMDPSMPKLAKSRRHLSHSCISMWTVFVIDLTSEKHQHWP
jgi:hypothetical protein